jgi:RHS repeat-associated protein
MPTIRVWPAFRDAEKDKKRFLQLVGLSDGIFQGMIVLGPLGGLHPVQHVFSIPGASIVKSFNSFRLDHLTSLSEKQLFDIKYFENEIFAITSNIIPRRAMPYTMPEDGKIHSISVYHEGGTGDLLLAVYNDDNGVPDQLLAVTEETAVDANKGWQKVELISPIEVDEGENIWLTFVFENNPGSHYKYTSGTQLLAYSTQTWASGMPSSFGSYTKATYQYAIYATYTPIAQPIELIGNPYMFTGRRFDLETGLYYYRARYYNPEIGRFLQTDPVGYGDSMNWYSYCGNNPIGFVDPSGMIVESYDWAGLGFGIWVGEGICQILDVNVAYVFYIPLDWVYDYDGLGCTDAWFEEHACAEVNAFFEETGYYNSYLGLSMNIEIEYSSEYGCYKVTIYDACNVDCTINLGILPYREEKQQPFDPFPSEPLDTPLGGDPGEQIIDLIDPVAPFPISGPARTGLESLNLREQRLRLARSGREALDGWDDLADYNDIDRWGIYDIQRRHKRNQERRSSTTTTSGRTSKPR